MLREQLFEGLRVIILEVRLLTDIPILNSPQAEVKGLQLSRVCHKHLITIFRSGYPSRVELGWRYVNTFCISSIRFFSSNSITLTTTSYVKYLKKPLEWRETSLSIFKWAHWTRFNSPHMSNIWYYHTSSHYQDHKKLS